MATLTFITGGQRSGKSSEAQKLAQQQSKHPLYIATAKIWDEEFAQRIKRHQKDRDEHWQTIEETLFLSKIKLHGQVAVLDCITLWLTNVMVHCDNDMEASLKFAKDEFAGLLGQEGHLIVVSNEIGMGLHANTSLGRKFTDLQGWMNQYIAQQAHEAIFMVAGLPLKIK